MLFISMPMKRKSWFLDRVWLFLHVAECNIYLHYKFSFDFVESPVIYCVDLMHKIPCKESMRRAVVQQNIFYMAGWLSLMRYLDLLIKTCLSLFKEYILFFLAFLVTSLFISVSYTLFSYWEIGNFINNCSKGDFLCIELFMGLSYHVCVNMIKKD